MIFYFCLILYFTVRALIESIHFDNDPSYNKFFDNIDEYHVYRAMEIVLVFLMVLTYNGGYITTLIGAFLIGDFIFERVYNATFNRWSSPYPFKFWRWTIARRWWFPIAELLAGLLFVCVEYVGG